MEKFDYIRIVNLTVKFAGRTVFENINATIRAGRKIQVTGSSGSGKSTLLKCLQGFIPAGGDIYYNDQKLCPENIWQLRLNTAYIPQEPIFQYPTVLSQLKAPFSFKANCDISFNEQKLGELLKKFSLPHSIKNASCGDLSGGEKQRVAVISAILLERPVMLFDEPTSALDAASREAMLDMLKNLHRTAAVIVSHDPTISGIADGYLDIETGKTEAC
jgi:putative ABC transport system ATP-binding protein